MKAHTYILLMLAALVLSACDRKQPVISEATPTPEPQSTPSATPPPLPTPSPTPTPEATPTARLAPDGVLYVKKPFTLTTETGLKGFPAGKEVRVIRVEAGDYIVSDGEFEARAAMDSFTNNLDERDAIIEDANQAALAIRQTRMLQQQAEAARQLALQKANEEALTASEKSQWEKEATALKAQHQALQSRINAAAKERESKGWPKWGGSKTSSSSTTVKALGSDASQIEQLIQAKQRIEARLEQLGVKH